MDTHWETLHVHPAETSLPYTLHGTARRKRPAERNLTLPKPAAFGDPDTATAGAPATSIFRALARPRPPPPAGRWRALLPRSSSPARPSGCKYTFAADASKCMLSCMLFFTKCMLTGVHVSSDAFTIRIVCRSVCLHVSLHAGFAYVTLPGASRMLGLVGSVVLWSVGSSTAASMTWW